MRAYSLTAFGAPLEIVWPLVPLASDHTVGVAIVSYNGRLCFGIVGDLESASDIDVMVTGIENGIAELLQVAHAAREAATP